MKTIELCASLALSLLGIGPVAANAQTTDGVPIPDSAVPAVFSNASVTAADKDMQHPLGVASEKARTLSVNVSSYYRDKNDDKWLPYQSLHLVFDAAAHSARADESRGSMMPALLAAEATGKSLAPAFSLFNGKETLEFDPTVNKYMRASGGLTKDHPRGMVSLDSPLLVARGFVSAESKPGSDAIIDGRRMITREFETGAPTNASDAHHPYLERYFIDTETHLLRRRQQYGWRDSRWIESLRSDYTGWVLDAPVAPTLFAWTPPTGATEFVPPALPKLLAVGTTAPDFTCIGGDGKPLKLSDLRGKTVVLDFWATWCEPCQRSMSHLERVYKATSNGGDIAVLALCVRDEKSLYDKWRITHKTEYTFPVAFDPAGKAGASVPYTAYQVAGIPTQYVIDKDGKVIAGYLGYTGEDDHRLEGTLAKLGVAMPMATKTAAK